MTRRSETVWWLCVCATIAALSAVIAHGWRTQATATEPTVSQASPEFLSALTEFQQASKSAHPTNRKAHQLLAVARASESDLQAMIANLVNSPKPLDEDLLRHILHRYTTLNPSEALAFMLATPRATQHSHMVFHNWGCVDFSAAVRALTRLPANQRRRAAINTLAANTHVGLVEFANYQLALNLPDNTFAFQRWANQRVATDATRGWTEVQQHRSVPYAYQYLSAWMQRDADAALQALESADFSTAEFTTAFEHVSRHAPRQALDWLEQTQHSEYLQGQQVSLLGVLAATDPEDAWQRSTSLPHTYRLPSQANILSVWGEHQPDEAAQWLLRYGDTSQMQSALGRLAVRQSTKQAAYDLVRFIDDPDLQRHTNHLLEQRWPG